MYGGKWTLGSPLGTATFNRSKLAINEWIKIDLCLFWQVVLAQNALRHCHTRPVILFIYVSMKDALVLSFHVTNHNVLVSSHLRLSIYFLLSFLSLRLFLSLCSRFLSRFRQEPPRGQPPGLARGQACEVTLRWNDSALIDDNKLINILQTYNI